MYINWQDIIGDDENGKLSPAQDFDSKKLHPYTEERNDTENVFFSSTNKESVKPAAVSENGKYYINCPYEERLQAKALGAKWDREKRKWYYTNPADSEKFSKWK